MAHWTFLGVGLFIGGGGGGRRGGGLTVVREINGEKF